MGELSARNFGLVIAYLVPGFIAVVSVAGVVPGVGAWLATSSDGQPSVGGFLYVTVASLSAGMLISSLRWLVIDTIHHSSGVESPTWDFSQLQSNLAAYTLLVDFHYRYYQFNANTLVAVAFAYSIRLAGGCGWCGGPGWADLGFVVIEAVLFATSRDTLRKYYARVSHVLRADAKRRKEKHDVKRRRKRTRTQEDGDQAGGTNSDQGGRGEEGGSVPHPAEGGKDTGIEE